MVRLGGEVGGDDDDEEAAKAKAVNVLEGAPVPAYVPTPHTSPHT